MHPSLVNIGAYIKTDVVALEPSARATGTVQGPAIDITPYKSGVLAVLVGAATGAPTDVSATFRFESRVPDGTWATVVDRDGDPITVEASAANGAVELDLDFTYVGDDHEELRVVQELVLVGGSSPTLITGALLVVGGSSRRPL